MDTIIIAIGQEAYFVGFDEEGQEPEERKGKGKLEVLVKGLGY